MPPLSGNRRAIALAYLICMLALLCRPTAAAAQRAQQSNESAYNAVASIAATTTVTANNDSRISEPDPNAANGLSIIKGYVDLLSPDRKIRKRAFRALYNQIFALGEVSFDFLGNPESLVSTLERAASSADKELAAAATYVISHIAMAGGNKKAAEKRGMAIQDSALSGPYQQFDKFRVNDTLARLATEAEGDVREYAVLAIFYQDVMSEKNDDLIVSIFRSANTDDDTLRWVLLALKESVYDMPGSNAKKRPISSVLAKALYELLRHEELPVRRAASKVLAYSNSSNARDAVIEGLISGTNDEVFEFSMQILEQHNSDDLKRDPRHREVMNSLNGESRIEAYSDFVRSLE